MNVKQYLEQLEAFDSRIVNCAEHIEDLKLMATGGGSIRYDKDRVQTSLTDSKLERDVVDYVALEQKHKDLIEEYVKAKETIIAQINGLDQAAHIDVLYSVYVQGNSIIATSKKMGRSYKYTKIRHQEALKAFEEKYAPLKRL